MCSDPMGFIGQIGGVPEFLLEPCLLGGLGSGELVLILVLVLLVVGPKKLPETARTIAGAIRGMRRAADEVREQIGLDETVRPRPVNRIPPAPGAREIRHVKPGPTPPPAERSAPEKPKIQEPRATKDLTPEPNPYDEN